MDFMSALDISASGMKAQRTHMNVISMNLANIKTTKTPEGGAYRRKSVAMAATPVYSPFDKAMEDEKARELKGVSVRGIITDKRPHKTVFEPGHPDANAEGYVNYPDINVVEEMANMITTMRSYEANVQAIQDTKAMFNKALQIAR